MRRYAGLFWAYVVQYARVRWEYRADLFVGVFSDLMYQFMSLVLVAVTFTLVLNHKGWTAPEVFFIYGYFLVPTALFGVTAGSLWSFADQYVVRGELDRVSVRPAAAVFQVLLEGVDLEPLLGLATGAATMLWRAPAWAWTGAGMTPRSSCCWCWAPIW